MRRTVIFGDIHGCYKEWDILLDRLAVGSSDRLISVGDLICKGPSSARTLDLAMSLPNLTCIVGNHELRFLNCWRSGRIPDIKPYDRETVEDMGKRFDRYMDYIKTWPFYLELAGLLVVHGGLRPGVPLQRQSREDLTNLRRVGPEETPWYEFYRGARRAVFGHWVRRAPLVRENAIGLDTGCVYGGKLSAFVWPEGRIYSVSARKAYARKRSWSHEPPREATVSTV